MKLVFERDHYYEILADLRNVLATHEREVQVASEVIQDTSKNIQEPSKNTSSAEPAPVVEPQGPSPETAPVKAKRGPKAKAKPPKAAEPEVPEVEADAEADDMGKNSEDEAEVANVIDVEAPAAQLDPATLMTIRNRTIEDLQSAYAGGKQKAVFDLLAKFGNGAKSFRELTVNEFVPIRKAIDEGALA